MPPEISERIKISAKAIRINELLSIREELKKQVDEALKKMMLDNAELAELLPARIDVPSCEKCGADLSFADVTFDAESQMIDATMLCKKCEPYE